MTTIKKGATDQTFYFKLVDSAAGTPKTGLTITAIDATYIRNQAAAVKNDLTALATAATAHTDNMGIQVDATNAPGLYRIDFPDAAFATGADKVILSVTCTGCDPAMKEIELVDNLVSDTITLIGTTGSGLTSLASAANQATIAGYLDTEIAAILAAVDTEVAAIKTKTDFLPSATAGATGGLFIAGSNAATTVNFTGTITTVTNLTNLPSITAGWITAAGIAASALDGKGDWNIGKTGYSLTQTFPSNFSSLSITAGGLVDISQTAADKAWGTAARVLTAGTNIALAKGTGVTGFNDLDAAGVATATWNAATATYGSAGSYGLLIETNLDAAVSSVSGGGGATAADIADAVWDEAIAGHLTAGSTGASLNGAGAAGDPWTAAMGGYAGGTAGQIFYDNLDAAISTRASQTTLDTVDNLLDTEIAAIKTDTAAILIDTAEIGAAGAGLTALATQVSVTAIDDLLDTEIADIRARLPAALVGGRMDVSLSAIDNSITTMAAFKRAVKGNVIGTVGVGSTTTSIVSSVLTPAGSVADQLKGRMITFSDDTTTANLRGQSTEITANTLAAAPTFTVVALTTAPVSTDVFCIT